MKGLPLGVEFSGGTIVIVQFDQMPSIDQVRKALDGIVAGRRAEHRRAELRAGGQRQIMVRVPETGRESGGELSRTSEDRPAGARKGQPRQVHGGGHRDRRARSSGRSSRSKGTLAFALSLFFILLYISFRFQFSFAVGATVATLHDLLITMAFLVFFRYDLSLNVIAALLTMTGYSTNDTIVIFDRVRENLRGMRRDNINEIVNVAVNQTLNRTIITGGTTLLVRHRAVFLRRRGAARASPSR